MSSSGAEFVSGGRERSRALVEERASRAATGLRSLGLEAGHSVALLLRNDFEFFEASFAATALSAYPVAVNWHLAAREVAYVLEDSAARVLVAHGDLLRGVPEAIEAARRLGVVVLQVATPPEVRAAYGLDDAACAPVAGCEDFGEWLAGFAPLAEVESARTETVIYTSGTTGLPKGVRRRPQSPEAAAEMGRIRDRIYGLAPGIHALVAGPLYHSAPNSFGLRAARQAGRLVTMPRFDPEGTLDIIARHRITTAFMVPTMLVRLLKLPEAVRARYDVSSLEHVMIAAAPCPPEVKRRIIEWWGPVVHEFYGATEVGYMTACTSAETLERPGTVGRIVPGVTLKALDADGNEVPAGTPGELYGRMRQFADFTYNNRPDERAAVERDGLITCGDVGYFDDDGYLYLCDRAREMVISGGVNIYPAEIESVLLEMPGVRDCAVFGIPDEEYGEKLMAVVQPLDAGAPPDTCAVVAFLRERLAGYKVPRIVEFRADLPRQDSGKIYKRQLRDPYWQGRDRKI